MDGCLNGGFQVRRLDPFDESLILNDFSSNVEMVINGKKTDQDKLLNELYYNNDNFNSKKYYVEKPKKIHAIPEEPRPIEPGQVDPTTFFGSSLRGII